jgi:hypothetical protein
MTEAMCSSGPNLPSKRCESFPGRIRRHPPPRDRRCLLPLFPLVQALSSGFPIHAWNPSQLAPLTAGDLRPPRKRCGQSRIRLVALYRLVQAIHRGGRESTSPCVSLLGSGELLRAIPAATLLLRLRRFFLRAQGELTSLLDTLSYPSRASSSFPPLPPLGRRRRACRRRLRWPPGPAMRH